MEFVPVLISLLNDKKARMFAREALANFGEPVLEALEGFDAVALQEALDACAEANEVSVFAYFPSLRYAVSGQGGGPDLLPMLAVLGKERVLGRLRTFLE